MSLNDPQWGKRGNGGGGPPDLDEIWRNVNRRMGELFGRKGDDGSGGGDRPPRRGMAMGGAGLLVALVLIVWLASGFYIVDEGRRGVVTLTAEQFAHAAVDVAPDLVQIRRSAATITTLAPLGIVQRHDADFRSGKK